jgi:Zn-dependent protease/CBS domain-containing protein
MRWAYPVGRVAGTEIRIHVTFLLLLALVAAGAARSGGAAAALEGTSFILLLFLSVVLHELGHALAARRYGISTPFIVLLPIGGIAALEGIPRQPGRELVMAAAGPAVNVAVALAIAAALRLAGGDAAPFDAAPGETVGMAKALLNANVALVLFNLLPAFPMDGGRMLRAALATRMEHVRATRIAARAGQGFALLLGAIGLATSPMLVLIAVVVYVGAEQESALVGMQAVAARHRTADAMVTALHTLTPDATLWEARALLLRTTQDVIPVLDYDRQPQGMVTSADVVSALADSEPHRPIARALRAAAPCVTPAMPLDVAVRRMNEARAPAVVVTDDAGQLLGIVTPDSVARLAALEGAYTPAPAAAENAPLPLPSSVRG